MPRKAAGKGKGRLVALEGASGPLLSAAGPRLMDFLADEGASCAISLWDASGIFHELRKAKAKKLGPSPRNLILFFAADLAFRLRREIRPALEEGRTVVAAPYVQSAMAFGAATGLPKKWIEDLFSFAPKPAVCHRVRESSAPRAEKGKAKDGYLEFCSSMLAHASPPWDRAELRAGFLAYLEALERRRGCSTLDVSSISLRL